ncbi:ABC transporter substrate-binding protein [Yeguia hominis]|uniref:Extracellular solute-binding protein n=1 Tax=Yeguia hominis TaxID=2763662 RepID=A0A926HR11_9FIRM|nr:extracellular solute-binding protein [Yeguia hominis]MBC8532773.1 extracellular solute-binding protein [Yeguia hominis]
MKKQTLSLLLALLLLMTALAGCSGGTGTDASVSESASSEAQSSTPAEDSSAAETPSIDPCTITYWEMLWGPAESHEAATKKVVDQFNAENEYGITVDVQMIPWEGYYQTFLTAVTSGAAPDVATGATPQPIQYAVMGESLDLDPIMEQWKAEGSSVLTEISDDLWEFFQYEGKQYGIAFGLDPKTINYRTDYFEEAGITELPTTWDEFADTLRTIKETFPDKIPMAFACQDSTCNHIMSVFLASNETGFVTADLKPNFSSKEGLEVLNFFKLLYDEELASRGAPGYADADVQKLYMSGECVIWGGAAPNIVDGTELAKVTGILPPLTGPSAKKGEYIVCPNGIMGFAQSENPDAARAFIKWWTENNLIVFTEGKQGNFPARSSYYSDSYYTENQLKVDIYNNCVSSAFSMIYPVATLYPQFSQLEGEQTYGSPAREIMTGEDPVAVAEKYDAEIQKVLDEYADD